ncbi:hypothetical protein BaRGS_00008546 [Batillaria attramentaria]|uniref:Secreted protein n=1 Tax=Batillaria attramentaria TaxID=370345 RepID=A0ABD0LMA2_9CAEN
MFPPYLLVACLSGTPAVPVTVRSAGDAKIVFQRHTRKHRRHTPRYAQTRLGSFTVQYSPSWPLIQCLTYVPAVYSSEICQFNPSLVNETDTAKERRFNSKHTHMLTFRPA